SESHLPRTPGLPNFWVKPINWTEGCYSFAPGNGCLLFVVHSCAAELLALCTCAGLGNSAALAVSRHYYTTAQYHRRSFFSGECYGVIVDFSVRPYIRRGITGYGVVFTIVLACPFAM